MKRSCESEEEREVKQVKLESESETDSYSSSEIGEFPKDSYFPYEEEDFNPSLIEKQIIRQTLSLISKCNMSDWACEIRENTMILRDVGAIVNDGEGIPVDIVVEVDYSPLNTYIKIMYSLNGEERQTIYLRWETEFIGDYDNFDTINITKYVEKTVYLFFTKSVKQSSDFNPRYNQEQDWSYFYDARMHLDRIRM